MYIYLITNLVNGKQYVGQTVQSINKRFQRHCWKCSVSGNMPIILAIQKYGKENFTISILAECLTIEELNTAEIKYALELNTFVPNGYNLRAGGGKGSMSEEMKRKIAQSNIGKKVTPETLRKLSESHKGIKLTDAAKQKLSQHFKGKRGSDLCYQRAAIANAKTYNLRLLRSYYAGASLRYQQIKQRS